MSVTAFFKKMAKRSKPLRIIMRKAFYGVQKAGYVTHGVLAPVDDRLIVFCAYGGRSFACSPKAIYEYILAQEKYKEYRLVWIFDHPEDYQFLGENNNTIIVKKNSAQCERFLRTAKYWIFNFRAPDHWQPRRGQEYVQCWHGTPLKKLGYDITATDNAMNSVREIREKYRTDAKRFSYLLSSCKFVTEKFTSAWNLSAPEQKILEIGYPRNDFLNNCTDDEIKNIRRRLGFGDCHKKLLLYAPTWRDDQFDPDKGYVYANPVNFDLLMQELSDQYIILFRAHYMVADNFDFKKYEGFVYDVSKHDDVNDLYVIADMLITDYSSVFFDYAILERPMIFFMYDMEKYRDEIRGFYLGIDELPGPVVKDEHDLIKAIRYTDDESKDTEKIRYFNNIYNAQNDGMASERAAEKILK